MQSDEQCVILLKMLPPDTPSTMVMALEECQDFDALKKKLEKQIDWFVDHPVSGNPLCPTCGRTGRHLSRAAARASTSTASIRGRGS